MENVPPNSGKSYRKSLIAHRKSAIEVLAELGEANRLIYQVKLFLNQPFELLIGAHLAA